MKGSEIVESHEKAEKDYMAGMKYKDIAEKYGTTINTVKSWKKRYGWNRKEGAHKKEKVCTQNKRVERVAPVQPEDGTKETLQNDELTPEQQMFCIYYSRTFNATQSYLKAYGCNYETALRAGPRLLGNVGVRAEIERLREIKRQQIVVSEEDIVELQMRIAFSDIGNYISFGKTEIETKSGEVIEVNSVDLKESIMTDTQLVRKVSEGKNGISIEVEDRQKAISWLTKYFLMHPEDKYKAEFDRRRAEVKDNSTGEILKNMQTITDILQHPVSNRSIEDFEGGARE